LYYRNESEFENVKILALDTSSQALAVAITENATLLAETTLNIKKNHSITLMPTIEFLFAQLNMNPADIDRIAVAQGPGSYTGIRIAVTTAKTLAYTMDKELVGVSSLYALAAQATEEDALVIPLMDARRNNVYTGVYKNGQLDSPECHTPFDVLLDALEQRPEDKLIFIGEVANFEQQIKDRFPEATVRPTLPSAHAIAVRGLELEPVNPHNLLPNYLKKVEAEENWLKTHDETDSKYI
jgi:tRNA threonylcarbamoyl adenosine modification protein YeaZ